MKNKGTLLVFLVLLTACSTKEYRVIPEENSAIVVEQDESQENVTEDIIDSEKDTQGEELTEIGDDTSGNINKEELYLSNGPEREYYTQGEIIELGEGSDVTFEEGTSFEVSIDDYEVFVDNNGSGRKGIAVYVTEKNTTNNTLSVGEENSETINAALIEVFYNNDKLKKHKGKGGQSEDYIANQYIEFNYDKAGVTTCLKEQDLKAGESRQCVYIYSYAGIGEYFIALSINVADNKWANYLLNVMNVSEKE